MSRVKRYKVLLDPMTEELLGAAVAAAMENLEPAFDAAQISVERQLAYRTILRELLEALGAHVSDTDLNLYLPEHLSEGDIERIVDGTVTSIEAIYLRLVATAVEYFRKTVLVAADYPRQLAS
jgi:hypothetical protein